MVAAPAGPSSLPYRSSADPGPHRRGAGAVHLLDLLVDFEDLFVCPECGDTLTAAWCCPSCPRSFGQPDGIPDLRTAVDSRTDGVREFYEHSPFPAYPPRDSVEWLRARAERSEFALMLDRAIPGDVAIVAMGCGTG